MSKMSTKENKNPYFLKREELKLTREAASELIQALPADRIEKIENERCNPQPDEILIMAEKYNSPELCNYYCSNQCPIGKKYVPEIKIDSLSKIVLNMLVSLNNAKDLQNRFMEITADEAITNEELEDFVFIQEELEKISITVEAMQLWVEQMLSYGKIDKELYNKIKNDN